MQVRKLSTLKSEINCRFSGSDNLSATLERLAAIQGPSHNDRSHGGQGNDGFPDQYELSMERFNNFEQQIQPLRQSSPSLEQRSPPSSENPHDEDEIMEQLFADAASSSQPWGTTHAQSSILPELPYVPYTPSFQDVIDISAPHRNAEAAEREVVVIEDSDDEVQIIDPPSQPTPATIPEPPAAATSTPAVLPSSNPWEQDLATLMNPWADATSYSSTSAPRPEASSAAASSHNRPQPSTPSPSDERRVRLPSLREVRQERYPTPWRMSSTSLTLGV